MNVADTLQEKRMEIEALCSEAGLCVYRARWTQSETLLRRALMRIREARRMVNEPDEKEIEEIEL